MGGYSMDHRAGEAIEHLARKVSSLTETAEDAMKQEKENNMGDIAGLLALMQGNKGMDLPGLLALCKDKGYNQGWGGEGAFLWVFLLFFLFANGGWNGMGRNNQEAFTNMAGNNCQSIIGIHDRISAAQAAATDGTQIIQSNLCESIASVITAVRNQGDRATDATRNVGDTVRDCCCKMEALLASVQCGLDGLGRDIRETSNSLALKIELEALKQENARAAMETRLIQQQENCCCETRQQFADLKCLIETNRMADENARLRRELDVANAQVSAANAQTLATQTAQAVVSQMQNFAVNHYVPTRTPTTGTTTG